MTSASGLDALPRRERGGHDPMCPRNGASVYDPRQCACALIARVRADEREAAHEAVAALQDSWGDQIVGRDDALAAIDALEKT